MTSILRNDLNRSELPEVMIQSEGEGDAQLFYPIRALQVC
jgi:hypothetical protein